MKKINKIVVAILGIAIISVAGIALYMYNQPHRDVPSAEIDFDINASALVKEYLNNPFAANEKYLSNDGQSKILKVTGIISNISDNYNNEKVVLLKSSDDKAGVSASFTNETNAQTMHLKIGDVTSIKGVIRSGASYDEDLELYENVILEKCSISK